MGIDKFDGLNTTDGEDIFLIFAVYQRFINTKHSKGFKRTSIIDADSEYSK